MITIDTRESATRHMSTYFPPMRINAFDQSGGWGNENLAPSIPVDDTASGQDRVVFSSPFDPDHGERCSTVSAKTMYKLHEK